MDVRIVYSPSDALKLARANPGKHVMFFAIGFETTAPSTALTLMRARAENLGNFSVFCNHVTIIPAIRAILDSPDMRIDAFIGPGHVSTVIGCRPYGWIANNEGKPIVVAGFEPLDVLQSIVMLLRQLNENQRKVENQYKRVVPWEGNRAALKAMNEVFEIRPYFEWRGLGFISQSALRIKESYAQWDAERRFTVPGVRVTDPKAAQCREVLKGVEAGAVQAVRQGVHARKPSGSADGIVRRLLRRILQLPASQGIRTDAPFDGLEDLPMTSAPPKIRFRDPQVEMAHGAGGIASRRLIDGLFAPILFGSTAEPLGDAAHVNINGTSVAITMDGFVVNPLRFPGGSIGELAVNGTVNDLAVSGARATALVVSYVLEAGLPTDILEAEVRAMANAARRAGVIIAGGDTKVVEHGKADRMYITTAGIGQLIPGVCYRRRGPRQ
jgi:hydrogenase expression/formation protein HypD